MNTTSRLIRACLIVAAILASASTATVIRAQEVVKANNTDALNLGSSWVGGSVPGSGDTIVWNSTVTAANTVLQGGDLSVAGIRIENPGGLIRIDGDSAQTLTVGAGGIDLTNATQNLNLAQTGTLAVQMALGAAQTWNVRSSRTITSGNTNALGVVVTNNNGHALTIDGGGTVYLGGYAGSGSLTVQGSSNLQIRDVGLYDYSGGLSVTGGTVGIRGVFNQTGEKPLGSGGLTVHDATLNLIVGNSPFTHGNNVTMSGFMSIANSSISAGNPARNQTFGTLAIGGDGTLSVTATGTNDASIIFGATTLTGSPSFDVGSREGNGLQLGSIGETGGARGFTKTGVGTLRLTGASSYTGTTTISGGILELTGAGSLPVAGAVVNDATLSVSGITASGLTIGSLAGSGSVALGGKALTLGDATNTLFSGELTGVGGSLVKQGNGTLTLSGSNSYSGGTTISAGMIMAANAAALGSAGTIAIGGSGMLGIADGVTFTRELTITSGGRVRTGNGSSVVVPSVASLAAWESISTAGAGTMADILFATGGTAGTRTLASSWVAGAGEGQFSDVLGLTGTVDSTFVLAMEYFGSPELPLLNIGYRSTPGTEFAPLGVDFVGLGAWNSSFQTVGQYGIDSQTNTVWVVADSNSQFVVMALAVPEPATIALVGVGLVGAVWMSRRRTRGVRAPA
jgi:fibronectin-binding autotransporter adhesin